MSFRTKRREFRETNPQDEGSEMNDTTLDMLEQIGGFKTRRGGAVVAVPEGALIPVGDGALQMGGYRLSKVGVTADETATYDQWEMLTKLFAAMEGAIQWILGDLITQGDTVYGQTYEQIASLMNREVTTLYDYVYVASKVEISVRTENLSFSHHKLVAAYSEEDQRKWLLWAAENKASVTDLRKKLNGDDDDVDTRPDPVISKNGQKALERLKTTRLIANPQQVIKDIETVTQELQALRRRAEELMDK